MTKITGFSPGLLRAWERRFGLLEPARSAGGHRLYTEDDLRVLLHVRGQLEAGRSIGALAAQGRAALLGAAAALPPQLAAPSPASRGRREADRRRAIAPEQTSFGRELDAARDRLVAAAIAIDPVQVGAGLEQAFSLVSSPRAVSEVLIPAAEAVGRAWASGTCSVAGEHLLTTAIQGRLTRLLQHELTRVPLGSDRVLCACVPGEEHALPGLIAAWRLARAGYLVTWLGAGLPLSDLAIAIRRIRPRAVVLSVTLASLWTPCRPALRELLGPGHDTAVLVGGAGAPGSDEELVSLGIHLVETDPVTYLDELFGRGSTRTGTG